MGELILGRGGASFEGHLREAIEINRERREIYSAMTGGRSRKLSNRLIWGERMSLAAAWYFDGQAARFWKEGIGVVGEDFVSMEEIRAPESPPVHRGVAGREGVRAVRELVRAAAKNVMKSKIEEGFEGSCRELAAVLRELEALEEEMGAHFTMVKHVLESAGLAALNGERWATMSEGATLKLSKGLVDLQLRWMGLFLSYDRLAQEMHREGCGILLNDVPAIPFLERWEEREGRKNSI